MLNLFLELEVKSEKNEKLNSKRQNIRSRD